MQDPSSTEMILTIPGNEFEAADRALLRIAYLYPDLEATRVHALIHVQGPSQCLEDVRRDLAFVLFNEILATQHTESRSRIITKVFGR